MSGEWKDGAAHAAYLGHLIHPDPEDCLPLADATTGLTGPAADATDLTAGRPQEPRSTPSPAIPTPQKRSALRIDLVAGIVDLRSLPLAVLYGDRGEYRRVLDMATDSGHSWSTTLVPSVVVVTRLVMVAGGAV